VLRQPSLDKLPGLSYGKRNADARPARSTQIARCAYVCMEHNRCSFAEFTDGLEVTSVRLGQATPASPRLGIKVEPQHNGLQYFTSLFILEPCRYRLIFAGDTSLSGVKLLRKQRDGFYLLRANERESNSA
jgi:hypothetical protein